MLWRWSLLSKEQVSLYEHATGACLNIKKCSIVAANSAIADVNDIQSLTYSVYLGITIGKGVDWKIQFKNPLAKLGAAVAKVAATRQPLALKLKLYFFSFWLYS